MPDSDGPLGLPQIRLEIVEVLPPGSGPEFLRLVRRKLRAHYPDGTVSRPFFYDEVDRAGLDSVILVAHYPGAGGQRRVYLRSALRPPVYFRDPNRSPIRFADRGGGLWELPAGLVEREEQSPEGLLRAAQRELLEETGFDVSIDRLVALGPSSYPVPGVIAERNFYFEVEVDPRSRKEPSLDGSALEQFGRVIDIAAEDALDKCRKGDIEDTKTELALRRLLERHP